MLYWGNMRWLYLGIRLQRWFCPQSLHRQMLLFWNNSWYFTMYYSKYLLFIAKNNNASIVEIWNWVYTRVRILYKTNYIVDLAIHSRRPYYWCLAVEGPLPSRIGTGPIPVGSCPICAAPHWYKSKLLRLLQHHDIQLRSSFAIRKWLPYPALSLFYSREVWLRRSVWRDSRCSDLSAEGG